MLDPNNRSLLVNSLRPPAGYVFSAGLATTYTLDLTTLLSVPLHLALRSSQDRNAVLQDGVALLEALRRTADTLSIFCQHGRIGAPNLPHVLYGLLEPCVIQVEAPNGGVFHPKLWLLRFSNPENTHDVILRLLLLSRNLTADRSWDLGLSLDGHVGKRNIGQNRPLCELVSALPNFNPRSASARIRSDCERFSEELRQTTWDGLPGEFERLAFHALGLKRQAWSPTPSRRLAVISPFVQATALNALAATTQEAVTLLSRPDELARTSKSSLAKYGTLMTLHEGAESADGEDIAAADRLAHGLHAKAYIAEDGWDTILYLGSANATNASLITGANVEIVAELRGKRSRVGGIDSFFGEDGLGEYLVEYEAPVEPPPLSAEEQAEALIDKARGELMRAGISVLCATAGEDAWDLRLSPKHPVKLKRITMIRIWPISIPKERSEDGTPLITGAVVTIPRCATASVTGFIAFELTTDLCAHSVCFVLSLPIENLPDTRDAAVLRMIVANRDGFLRYLLLLLQDIESLPTTADLLSALGGAWKIADGLEGMPLLEELVRAYSRDPDRLDSVRKLVEQLGSTPEGQEMIPEEFMNLWQVFETTLAQGKP